MRLNKKLLSLLTITIITSSLVIGCSKEETTTNPTTSVSTENNQNETQDQTLEDEVFVTIYVPDVDNDCLTSMEVEVDKKFDEHALISLLQQNSLAIPKDTKVNNFEIQELNGEIVLSLDLNENIYLENIGSSEEILMLDALSKSFLQSYGGDKLKITVNGSAYESGHIYLEEDFIFENSATFNLRESLY